MIKELFSSIVVTAKRDLREKDIFMAHKFNNDANNKKEVLKSKGNIYAGVFILLVILIILLIINLG